MIATRSPGPAFAKLAWASRAAVLAGFATLAPAAAEAAETYAFDIEGAHASVHFKVPHLNLSFIVGRFNAFDGAFTIDEDNPSNSSVTVTVDTTSLDTNHAARDKHLRGDDFLNVEEFPEARFTSTRVEVTGENTADVTGDFTFMGVTRPMTIEVVHLGAGDDPWGGFRRGFEGTARFNTKDFGMQSRLAADMEVELHLVVEGKRL